MIACAIRRKHQSPCGGRGQKSVTHHHTGNGAELTANGHVSPQALWQHAAKLEPKAPWRAVIRELGAPRPPPKRRIATGY